MTCPYCGWEWRNKVEKPRKCPNARCQRALVLLPTPGPTPGATPGVTRELLEALLAALEAEVKARREEEEL